MQLSELYKQKPLTLSFELFPPRTPAGERQLYRTVEQLMKLSPDFMTCTYGAGGSTRDKTLGIVAQIKQRFDIPVASHLTVVESTVDDLREYLRRAADEGVDYIVALRGDPPEGAERFVPKTGGLRYANELVEMIRAEFPQFGIAVAGYPEVHREAPSAEADLENLKRKVDAGADVVITQLFYDNDDYFRFVERCQSIGIDVPIVPGVLPVISLGQIRRIANLCGAKLPQAFIDRLSERDDPDWQYQVGVEQAVAQTQSLLKQGVPGLHYYVLNRSDAMQAILESVDMSSMRSSS